MSQYNVQYKQLFVIIEIMGVLTPHAIYSSYCGILSKLTWLKDNDLRLHCYAYLSFSTNRPLPI